jgi:type IX secretion system PorP/SprF family membrane protein
MMRKLAAYLLFFLFPVQGSAQLFSLTDQYLNNMMLINPAFAGCHDALSAAVSYRSQWVGFSDAPENITLSVHSPLNNDRIGLGFMVNRVSTGIFNTTDLSADYAFRIEMGEGIFSLGAGFGVSLRNVAWNRLNPSNPNDPLITNEKQSAVLPDFSLGAYYYNSRFFAGFSAPGFLTHMFDKNSGKYVVQNNFSDYTLLLTGGMYAELSDRITFFPSALLMYNRGHSPQLDINASLILNDLIWVGAGYRTTNTVTAMLRCRVNYQVMMAYSYGLDLGQMGSYNNGSHEVTIGYVFRYLRQATGPRQF